LEGSGLATEKGAKFSQKEHKGCGQEKGIEVAPKRGDNSREGTEVPSTTTTLVTAKSTDYQPGLAGKPAEQIQGHSGTAASRSRFQAATGRRTLRAA
jgi:hypothetical protein